jgi:hypothetical protein
MATVIQRETTEFLYVGVTGDVPAEGGELAFLEAGVRPTGEDWEDAILVPDDSHELWDDAVAATQLAAPLASPDFFLAILVGTFGTPGGLELAPGDYQVWLRLTDTVERPVRIAPIALEVA